MSSLASIDPAIRATLGLMTNWGYDTRAMDKRVRPQDDFYHYANGAWLKRNKIPPAESRWGAFNILRHTTEKQVRGIVTDILKKKSVKKGSPEQLVRDLYRSGMDEKTRERRGIAPLKPYLEKIDGIKNQKGLQKVLAELHLLGVTVPWGYGVDQDSKNSEKYVLHFYQSGLGMPDRDYYLKDEAEFVRVRTAYVPFIKKLLALVGKSPQEAAHAAEVIMKVETKLAEYSMNKVDLRDAEKTYHKKSFAEFKKLAPHVDWNSYFKTTKIPNVPYAIVTQPDFVRDSARLLSTLSLEEWKTYLTWHLVLDGAAYLSRAFVRTNFEFYGRTLIGQKVMKPLWRRVLASINGSVGFALGRMYIDRYFGAEAKSKMNELVNDLFDAYEGRMRTLDWMSTGTKKKAIHKLRAVSRKIGYPSKWKSYSGLVVKPDDYFGNILRAGEHSRKREMKKLKKKMDRTEWHMTPQTVNAYCNFNMNEIVFPAAILQYPFFNLSADDAVNYGAIGSIIGHEMTHAFDDQGSKFDEHGNMRRWWTLADRKRFEKKTAILVKQFNGFKVVDGVKVNGKLTLGENIADLGGAVIAFDALQKHLKKHGRKNIDGFTPEQRFFLGFAQQEQELVRPEFQKMTALNDPHSPAVFRINGPLAHVPAFYDAFGVKKGDKLYREPKLRAHIW